MKKALYIGIPVAIIAIIVAFSIPRVPGLFTTDSTPSRASLVGDPTTVPPPLPTGVSAELAQGTYLDIAYDDGTLGVVTYFDSAIVDVWIADSLVSARIFNEAVRKMDSTYQSTSQRVYQNKVDTSFNLYPDLTYYIFNQGFPPVADDGEPVSQVATGVHIVSEAGTNDYLNSLGLGPIQGGELYLFLNTEYYPPWVREERLPTFDYYDFDTFFLNGNYMIYYGDFVIYKPVGYNRVYLVPQEWVLWNNIATGGRVTSVNIVARAQSLDTYHTGLQVELFDNVAHYDPTAYPLAIA